MYFSLYFRSRYDTDRGAERPVESRRNDDVTGASSQRRNRYDRHVVGRHRRASLHPGHTPATPSSPTTTGCRATPGLTLPAAPQQACLRAAADPRGDPWAHPALPAAAVPAQPRGHPTHRCRRRRHADQRSSRRKQQLSIKHERTLDATVDAF